MTGQNEVPNGADVTQTTKTDEQDGTSDTLHETLICEMNVLNYCFKTMHYLHYT